MSYQNIIEAFWRHQNELVNQAESARAASTPAAPQPLRPTIHISVASKKPSVEENLLTTISRKQTSEDSFLSQLHSIQDVARPETLPKTQTFPNIEETFSTFPAIHAPKVPQKLLEVQAPVPLKPKPVSKPDPRPKASFLSISSLAESVASSQHALIKSELPHITMPNVVSAANLPKTSIPSLTLPQQVTLSESTLQASYQNTDSAPVSSDSAQYQTSNLVTAQDVSRYSTTNMPPSALVGDQGAHIEVVAQHVGNNIIDIMSYNITDKNHQEHATAALSVSENNVENSLNLPNSQEHEYVDDGYDHDDANYEQMHSENFDPLSQFVQPGYRRPNPNLPIEGLELANIENTTATHEELQELAMNVLSSFRKKRVRFPNGTSKLPQQCEFCLKVICNRKKLREHQFSVHFKNVGDFHCKVCNKRFVYRRQFNAHLITHSDERTFNCKYCGLTCKRRSHLHKHMETHKKEKNFRLLYIINKYFNTLFFLQSELTVKHLFP